MTFPYSLSHTHIILSFLMGFSLNNLCFSVFSCRSMHYLSVAFSRCVRIHTNTPLWLDLLLRMTKALYYLLLFIIADGTIISWPLHHSPNLPLHMFLFIQTSLTFSFSCLPSLPFCMFIQTHLFFFSPAHPFSLPVPVCPAFVTSLVSITTATFQSVPNHF